VDAHFAACANAYTALVRRAGFAPGWHVLDAGCGSGSFLPLLAGIVGEHGRLSAIDLAPEHVARAARRWPPAEVVHGSLLELPFPDASFDGVWCANTVQYLDDDQLRRALAELRRVVRPGGLVAVKDLDASTITARPADPFLFTDFFRRAAAEPGYARQLLRSRDLYRFLAGAGLARVRQETVLIEHFGPLSDPVRRFYGPSCGQIARQALGLGVPGDWEPFLDPESPLNPLNDPAGYLCEGNVLAVGTNDG
jgi:ubiquinone/menaquinone biosynthesis C-methylase UbiE